MHRLYLKESISAVDPNSRLHLGSKLIPVDENNCSEVSGALMKTCGVQTSIGSWWRLALKGSSSAGIRFMTIRACKSNKTRIRVLLLMSY